MQIELKALNKKDEKKAIQFAVKGMHFDWYLDNKIALNLYGRYFWYLETSRATQMIAAYADNRFVGVILAEINGEPKLNSSIWRKMYVKLAEGVQRFFFKDSVGVYDKANKKMYQKYIRTVQPSGEIIFLAADPDCGIKGVGSKLLAELENREKGKIIYLYTDNACTYQFYEHRGFERVGEERIELDMGNRKVPLTCLLYSKVLGER
ncbi:GNAT family N-acetyltransferase [Ruminococcus sp. Marseille-P6503]|uniref:GNAT family N-acetyltransferase n=1 Tax=Ruminococcus sp. Marseille-P6503 TaxID=2364796 RepID=UPI000F549F03|nr:GNAT family N-acetyltransferase [Ruminococcus sp. Marseille-P6503]